MSINRKSTLFLGIFIFIIPFLGFPSIWKAILTIASGLLLIIFSVKIQIPKKGVRRIQREKVTQVFVESVPLTTPNISPRNDTIEVISNISHSPKEEIKISEPEIKVTPVPAKPKRTRASKKTNGPAI